MGGVFKPIQGVLSLLLLLALMTGCGEAGILFGAEDEPDVADEAFSVGPVAGARDDVIVNGTRFVTRGTEFLIDDVDGLQADLAKGMLVSVEVDDNRNQAERIVYEDDIRGPVLAEDFNPIARTLVVLGQTVRFNDATVFDDLSLDEIAERFALGDNRIAVRVSGWHLDSGDVLASYINATQFFFAALGQLKVQGIVTDVDPAVGTLTIGDLILRYDQSTRIDMGAGRDQILLTDIGAFVDVEGYVNDIGGTMVAQEITEESRLEVLGGFDDEAIAITGAITRGLGADSFDVAGIRVELDAGDTDLNGLDSTNLQQGRRVFVEGVGTGPGALLAERIEDRDPEARVDGLIQDIAPSVDEPNRVGRMLVAGVPVEVTLRTLVVDPETDLVNFDIQFRDLVPSEFVEVAGIPREDEGGQYIEAVKVERDPLRESDAFLLGGRVQQVDRGNSTFRILGFDVRVDDATEFLGSRPSFDSLRVEDRLNVGFRPGPGGDFIADTIDFIADE